MGTKVLNSGAVLMLVWCLHVLMLLRALTLVMLV